MKFLVDMNLSPRWVDALAGRGLTAVHWSTHGAARSLDAEIMTFAKENDYIVLTHDLDFGSILAVTQGLKPNVIQIRAELTAPELIATQVISSIKEMRTKFRERCAAHH